MKVLAVDQSYTSSGIVLLENENVLHCERYVTDKDMDIFDRAYCVAVHVVDIVETHKPDIIAVEGLAFATRGNATRDLAGLQFVLINYLRDAFTPHENIRIVAPNTAKKTAGFGHKEKADMITALPKDVHKKFSDLGVKKTTGMGDLADAYWIGRSI